MPIATPYHHTANNITESLSEHIDTEIATLLGHKITEAFYSADYIADNYKSPRKHYATVNTGYSKHPHIIYRFTVPSLPPIIPTVFLYYTTTTSRIRICHDFRLLINMHESHNEEHLYHETLLQSDTTEPWIIYQTDLNTIDFESLKHTLNKFNPYNACAKYIQSLFDHYYTTLYFRIYLLKISTASYTSNWTSKWQEQTFCERHHKLATATNKLQMVGEDSGTMQVINQCHECNHSLNKYIQNISSKLTPRNQMLHDLILAKLNPTPADRKTGLRIQEFNQDRIF